MLPARRASVFALLLSILVWTGTTREEAANTCKAEFDSVSFMQLSRKVTHAEARSRLAESEEQAKIEDVSSEAELHDSWRESIEKLKKEDAPAPGNNPAINAGYAEQQVLIYVQNATTTPEPTEPATEEQTTPAPYTVQNLMYPLVTVPPGQVKVSIYMDQATLTTTTTTTTLTMRIQIIINSHGTGPAPLPPPAPPPSTGAGSGSGPAPALSKGAASSGNSGSSGSSGSSTAETLQKTLENNEKIYEGGGPGSSGYDSLAKYLDGQAGATGSFSDVLHNAEQSMGSATPPAPPPPYLSPISVNEHAAKTLGGKNMLLKTTTKPANDMVSPLKGSLSDKDKKNRAQATLDCELSQWAAWSACDTMSGDIVSSMQSTRERQIIQMQQPGGMPCGVLTESKVCNT